jgi:DNA-binding MarR family transcriptional regulator
LLATLTSKGEKVISEAMDANATGLEEAMHDLSPEELDVLQRLLGRMREDFVRRGRERLRRDGVAKNDRR